MLYIPVTDFNNSSVAMMEPRLEALSLIHTVLLVLVHGE